MSATLKQGRQFALVGALLLGASILFVKVSSLFYVPDPGGMRVHIPYPNTPVFQALGWVFTIAAVVGALCLIVGICFGVAGLVENVWRGWVNGHLVETKESTVSHSLETD